jgi:histidinol-phosphate aminotransferase
VAERGRIAAELAGRGWEALPSVTNFVLVRPPTIGATAAELGEALLSRGLVVRTYPGGPLRDWLRITARAAVENDRLLAALDELD